MKQHFTLSAFLCLLICLTACGSSDNKTTETITGPIAADSAAMPPTTGADFGDANQITGILQTSGLQASEAKALGLQQGNYQLISQTAYFLNGPDSLEKYLGQCLTLSGQLIESNDNDSGTAAGQTDYSRKLFAVEGIHPQLFSYCHFSDTTQSPPQGREVTYTGAVERMQRPAPDIAYDYQLRLQKPYRDPNHPVEPGKLVRSLPLVTADFEVLSKLETAVRQEKQLHLRGIQHQGYAESEAVWVTAADSLALRL